MAIQFSNQASTTLASGASSSATSLSVTGASSFPVLGGGDYCYATLGAGTSSEIVKVTGISGTTFTVVRGQDNTTATSHLAGADVSLRVTAGALEDLRDGGQVYTAGAGLNLSANQFSLANNFATDVTFSADIITATAGTSNFRAGFDAGTNLASGSTGNTFVGDNAGKDNTTGDNNVAVGKGALENNTTAVANVAVGMEALLRNTTGQSNSAIGFRTLSSNTTGNNNMGIGQATLRYSTTGNNNLAIGVQSLFKNTTGTSNVGLGLHALYNNVTGNYNTASGTQALKFTTAADNTAMGGQAGMGVTSGTLNSFFGRSSGSLVTTGSRNTILGAFDGNENGLDIRTSSNNIVLSDGAGNPRLSINSSGAATFASTVNGRDVAADGAKLDDITASANNYSHPSNHAISVITGLQTALDNKVDDTQVLTNVPANALFTDTTYSVGNGGLTTNDFTNADHTKLNGIAAGANNYTLPSGYATEGFVSNQITALVDSSPATLNTLNELAAALGDDPNFATTVTTNIGTKLSLAGGTVTGNLSVTGTTTSGKLILGSNTVGTTSDIALTANAAINAVNSLSFGMTDNTGSYFRWMFGNTSNTGGTAGGVEKMKLDPSGNLTLSGTVDGVDIAARDAVLTSTKTTADAALANDGTSTGNYSTSGQVQSGRGSGGVALTTNDGYGNANVTFNHLGGVPEQTGNAARIEFNTDSLSTPTMTFELGTGTAGTAFQTPTILTLSSWGATVTGTLSATGGNSTNWNTAYGWGDHSTAGYAATTALGNYLPLIGGSLAGNLSIGSAASPTLNLYPNATTGYPQVAIKDNSGNSRFIMFRNTASGINTLKTASATNVTETELKFSTNGNVYVNGAAPTASNHLTRKDYVDSADALRGSLAGTNAWSGANNFRTDTNSNPLRISRTGGNVSQLLDIGVDDAAAVFRHVGDEANEGRFRFYGDPSDAADTLLLEVNMSEVSYKGNEIYHEGNFTPSNYLPLTGGTMTGQLNVRHAGTNSINLRKTADTSYNGLTWSDAAGTSRWLLYQTNNAQGDLSLQGRRANGAYQHTTFVINNNTGVVDFRIQPTLNGSALLSAATVPSLRNQTDVPSTTWNTHPEVINVYDNALLGSEGGFRTSWVWNGYRNSAGGFTYRGVNSNTTTASNLEHDSTSLVWRAGSASGIALPTKFQVNSAGATDLYYNGSKKFITTSIGTRTTGIHQATDGSTTSYIDYSGLYSSRSLSYIRNTHANGSMYINTNNQVRFRTVAGLDSLVLNSATQKATFYGDVDVAGDLVVTGANVATDSALLGGVSASVSDVVSTIVKRGTTGDVYARLFRSTYQNSSAVTAGAAIMMRVNNSNDTYLRPVTQAGFRAEVTDGVYEPVNTIPTSGDWWSGGYSKVNTDGTHEIGKYIDFHSTSSTTADNTYRMTNTASGQMSFSGSLTAAGNITAYSDERLKRDIEIIPDALAKVSQLKGVTFTDKETEERRTGLIAQDVQKVLSEAVIQPEGQEHLAIAYGNTVGLLVEAIKELKAEVDELKSQLENK